MLVEKSGGASIQFGYGGASSIDMSGNFLGSSVSAWTLTATTEVETNTINERTAGSGVTVDSVLIKDGQVDGRDVSADGTQLDNNT